MKCFFLVMLFTCLSQLASAETILVQQLNMGNLVIANNDVPQEVSIDEFGTFSATSGFRVIERGQVGIYRLTELPVSSTVNVMINIVNTRMQVDTATLESFDFEIVRQEQTVLSNADGEAELRFGGKITTSGSSSVQFTDGQFTSSIRITVNN